MNKGKFYGIIKEGKAVFDDRLIFDLFAKRLEGKRFELTLQKESEDGTDSQRGYWFACIVRAAVNEGDFKGWTADEIDGYLCKKFLTVDKGTPKERIRSRSAEAGFTKEDWSELIENGIKNVAEHGVTCLPQSKLQEKKR